MKIPILMYNFLVTLKGPLNPTYYNYMDNRKTCIKQVVISSYMFHILRFIK